MVAIGYDDDPCTYEEAVKHKVWRKAMDSKIKYIEITHGS